MLTCCAGSLAEHRGFKAQADSIEKTQKAPLASMANNERGRNVLIVINLLMIVLIYVILQSQRLI